MKRTTKHKIKAEINLHYELHVPEGAEKAPLLISVHGYAAHAPYMMREALRIVPENYVVASIQGPNKFYRQTDNGEYKLAFGWLTDFEPGESIETHHYFINTLIDGLASYEQIDPANVTLFGFSQASALNFRYAFTFPSRLRRIIALCGGIPSDLDSNDAYSPTDAEVHYLYGNDDEFYSNEKFDAFDKKLSEYLSDYSSRQFDAPHIITEEMREYCRKTLG